MHPDSAQRLGAPHCTALSSLLPTHAPTVRQPSQQGPFKGRSPSKAAWAQDVTRCLNSHTAHSSLRMAGPRSSRPLCHGDVGAGWQSGPLCPRGSISLRRCGVGWDASLLPSDRGGVASLIRLQELQPCCLHSKSQLHHMPACVTRPSNQTYFVTCKMALITGFGRTGDLVRARRAVSTECGRLLAEPLVDLPMPPRGPVEAGWGTCAPSRLPSPAQPKGPAHPS